MSAEELLARGSEVLAHDAFVRTESELMRRSRWAMRMSQKDVAAALDVPQAYISRVENGSTTGIGRDVLGRIVEFYRRATDAYRASRGG